jgi:hypothetical protein
VVVVAGSRRASASRADRDDIPARASVSVAQDEISTALRGERVVPKLDFDLVFVVKCTVVIITRNEELSMVCAAAASGIVVVVDVNVVLFYF